MNKIGILKNGEIFDTQSMITGDKIIEIGDDLGLSIMRHSFAHILAQALKRVFQNVSCYVGPVTDFGFFYDVEILNKNISTKDFNIIETEMIKIIK